MALTDGEQQELQELLPKLRELVGGADSTLHYHSLDRVSGSVQSTTTALAASGTVKSNSVNEFSGVGMTFTLPSSPSDSDTATFINAGTDLTNIIAPNAGQTIMGVAQNMTFDVLNAAVTLKYISATTDWRIV